MDKLTQNELAFQAATHLRLHNEGFGSIFDGVSFNAEQSAALLALAEYALRDIAARSRAGRTMTPARIRANQENALQPGRKRGPKPKPLDDLSPGGQRSRKSRAKGR